MRRARRSVRDQGTRRVTTDSTNTERTKIEPKARSSRRRVRLRLLATRLSAFRAFRYAPRTRRSVRKRGTPMKAPMKMKR